MKTRTPLEPGREIAGFLVERSRPLPSLSGYLLELTHTATGAHFLHIATPDENRSFALNFATPAPDSSGVAHVLEHLVIAGSRHFPVRGALYRMGSRSLARMVNAQTNLSWTSYFYATPSQPDFLNLLEVVLDGCFHPLLLEDDFLREAHHLEFERSDDPSSPLVRRGVVYSEMQGMVAGNQNYLLERATRRALYPDLPYAHDFAGDPEAIPSLTYEAARAFHARYYQPSNASFYTCGDLDLEPVLEAVDRVISGFGRGGATHHIPDQPRFTQSVRLEATMPLAAGANPKLGQALLAWLTVPATDTFEVLALRVLHAALLSNSSAPLARALLAAFPGAILADAAKVEGDRREVSFAVGLKHLPLESADAMETLILEHLRETAERGIDPALVDAAMRRLELRSREANGQGWTTSLKLLRGIAAAHQHGADPLALLDPNDDLHRLEGACAGGEFLERLIRERLLENPHRALVVLRPNEALLRQQADAERTKLEAIRARLSDEQKCALVAQSERLRQIESAPSSLLPILALDDLPRDSEPSQAQTSAIHSVPLGLCTQATNSVTYLELHADATGLPDDLLALLPFFAHALTRSGVGTHDASAFTRRIEAVGALTASLGAGSHPSNPERVSVWLALQGRALERYDADLVALVGELLGRVRLESESLVYLLGRYRAELEAGLLPNAYRLTASLAEASLDRTGALRDQLAGYGRLETARALSGSGLTSGLRERLEALRDALFRPERLAVCATASEDRLQTLLPPIGEQLKFLERRGTRIVARSDALEPRPPTALALETPVAYLAAVYPTVPYDHPDAPALLALRRLLDAPYLAREIRERGGAYGGGCWANPETGRFGMYSFRDPDPVRSLEGFAGAAQFALEAEITADALQEAVIGAFNDLQPRHDVDSRAAHRFFSERLGYSPEVRRDFAARLVRVTADDLRRVAITYLETTPGVALIANADTIQQVSARASLEFNVG